MSNEQRNTAGGCLCGAIRYEFSGEPTSVLHCHCESCRRHTGAPVVTLVGLKRPQLRYTLGEPRVYRSSPGVGRAFCADCGTPLTWEGDGGALGPLVEVHISTFDEPSAFRPQLHIHDDERLEWFEVADSLPRYHEWDEGEPSRHGPVDDS